MAQGPAAIGFVNLSQLPPNEKSVKLVQVVAGKAGGPHPNPLPKGDGTAGGGPNALAKGEGTGKNPLERTLTLYVSPKASKVAKDFTAFLTPAHCKTTIAQYNLLPPLHWAEPELAKGDGPPPDSLPKDEGASVASADERDPPSPDKPDAPPDHIQPGEGKAKSDELAAKPAPAAPTAKRPETPKPIQEHPTSPSLSQEQAIGLVSIAGVAAVAIVIGVWLRAPHRKRKHR